MIAAIASAAIAAEAGDCQRPGHTAIFREHGSGNAQGTVDILAM